MNTKVQFHDEDQDSVQLIGDFFAKHDAIKKVEYTADYNQYCSHDIVLTTITGKKIYIEVKDRRDHIHHTKRNHYPDVIIDVEKKERFVREGIYDRVIVVAVFDDGVSFGCPKKGHLKYAHNIDRYTNSKSFIYNKTPDIVNYKKDKIWWSMPIEKFITQDLRPTLDQSKLQINFKK